MAGESKQIYQLTNGTFNGSSLVPFEVPNTDPSTSTDRPYITRKTTGDEVSEFVAKTQEFETDLETDNKTIIGAINEVNNNRIRYVEKTINLPSEVTCNPSTACMVFDNTDLTQLGVPADAMGIKLSYSQGSYLTTLRSQGSASRFTLRCWNITQSVSVSLTSVVLGYLTYS